MNQNCDRSEGMMSGAMFYDRLNQLGANWPAGKSFPGMTCYSSGCDFSTTSEPHAITVAASTRGTNYFNQEQTGFSFQTGKNTLLVKAAAAILENGQFSDVIINVGAGDCKKSFKCHTLFLVTASDVFKQMFYGSMAERDRAGWKDVDISDIEPDTFKLLLRFIYKGETDLRNVEDAILLHAASHKYMIGELEAECLQYIMCNMDRMSALYTLEYAILLDNQLMKSNSLFYISEQSKDTLKSEAFLDIKVPTIKLLLTEGNFDSDPSNVLDAILKYAGHQVNKNPAVEEKTARDFILKNNIFPGVRFEFGDPGTDVFTQRERKEILESIRRCNGRQELYSFEDPPKSVNNQFGSRYLHSLVGTRPHQWHKVETFVSGNYHGQRESYPRGPFECNILIRTTVDVWLHRIVTTTDDYANFNMEVEFKAFGGGSSRVQFKDNSFNFVKRNVKFSAGVEYVWNMKFRRIREEGGGLCQKMGRLKAVEKFGKDTATVGTISLEMSGFIPGNIMLVLYAKEY